MNLEKGFGKEEKMSEDLAKEVETKKEVTLESLKKGLIINRIIGLACFVILAGIFVVAVMAYNKVNTVLVQTQPALNKVQQLDLDRIENSINEINVFVEKTDFDHASKVIESVPEDIFDQVKSIQLSLEEVAKFADMKDDFKEAMDNLDKLTVQLDEFQKKMDPLLRLFSK